MREFKFRAWNPRLKEMLNFDFSDIISEISKGGCLIFDDNPISIRDLIIMQYLGEDCKDCNGIELCEGDIVEHWDEKKRCISLINWNTRDGAFWPSNERFNKDINKWKSLKIIGNRYQNPELLNE